MKHGVSEAPEPVMEKPAPEQPPKKPMNKAELQSENAKLKASIRNKDDAIEKLRQKAAHLSKGPAKCTIHQPDRHVQVVVYDIAADGTRLPSTHLDIRGENGRVGIAIDAGLRKIIEDLA